MGASVQSSNSSGQRGRRRGRSAAMGDINITPFVDVMLVLLIIFMVAAPLLVTGVNVDLPESAAGELEQNDQEPIVVVVRADGSVSLKAGTSNQEVTVSRAEFLAKMSANSNKDTKVMIQADKGVDYGIVMEYVGLANQAGFNGFAFLTLPASKE